MTTDPPTSGDPGRDGRRGVVVAARARGSRGGQLGVVSGTALDAVLARSLQDGETPADIGAGHWSTSPNRPWSSGC